MSDDSLFPRDFLFGAATSAYQVEGSPLADGAGPSIWQRFVHTPGRIRNGDTGDVACDHYRRYLEDVELMSELGLEAYRFSIAWSRVLPDGRGRVNGPGLDFYDRLVDALRSAGIRPLVTLFHWDLPAALDDRGGWLNPDVADWFGEYAALVFRRLDDRVEHWLTLNEPWVVMDGGYLHGPLAPGHANPYEAPIAAHNLLRAHAAGMSAYRAEGRHAIGLAVNLEPKYPASTSPEDLEATARAHAYMNRYFLDPLFRGRYPRRLADVFGDAWEERFDREAASLRAGTPDFLAVNYYTRSVVRNDPEAWPVRARAVRQEGAVYSDTGWEVYPQGLSDTLRWVHERYGPIPLYITENGAAFPDPPQTATEIDDPLRVDYLRRHLLATHESLASGIDLRGYFVWSLLDNFEWALGFAIRFGIVHVDYTTQRRTPKASARFYARVIRTRGAALRGEPPAQ